MQSSIVPPSCSFTILRGQCDSFVEGGVCYSCGESLLWVLWGCIRKFNGPDTPPAINTISDKGQKRKLWQNFVMAHENVELSMYDGKNICDIHFHLYFYHVHFR